MKLGREDSADGLPGRVSAVRATLETTRGDETARDRFWKLQGIADGDHWQIALHADSKALFNFKNDDESTSSLRDGGAYAFFPLNDALAEWLETHAAKRHPDWQVERLFREEPHEGALWSHEIFTRLKLALRDRPLLRTLWGLWRRAPEALAVRLSMSGIPRRAWRELCAEASYVGDQNPPCEGRMLNSDTEGLFGSAALKELDPLPDRRSSIRRWLPRPRTRRFSRQIFRCFGHTSQEALDARKRQRFSKGA